MLTPETDLGTCPGAPRHHAPAIGQILQRHAGHLGDAGTLSGPDRRGRQQGEEASAGLAAIPGLHGMLGIDAASEPSGCRRRRARSAFVGIPRGDHGGRGRRRESNPRSRGQGRQRQVSGGGRGRHSDRRWRRLLHHRRPLGAWRSRRQCAATPRRPSRSAPARSMAGWSGPSRIRPARWEFRKPCRGSRSSTWRAARTIRPTRRRCWCTT